MSATDASVPDAAAANAADAAAAGLQAAARASEHATDPATGLAAEHPAARATARPSRWRTTRTWRLAFGVVMLACLSMHLAAHMPGLHALARAETGLRITMAPWHSVPGTPPAARMRPAGPCR